MFDEYSPIFVLSTGRSGSKLIHHAFKQLDDVNSYHEAFPNMQYFSNFAFHNQHKPELLQSMFMSARFELILNSYNQHKIYAESNQCLSFYAFEISKIFANAKFVHLIRHPGSFIRSALMKGWHLNDSIWESGRIKMNDVNQWKQLSHTQKLGWVWKATNEYIHNFCNSINPGRYMVVKLEDITRIPEKFESLLQFTGSKSILSMQQIAGLQQNKINELHIDSNEPDNMFKSKNYPVYDEWSDEKKESVKEYVKDLANIFSYEL